MTDSRRSATGPFLATGRPLITGLYVPGDRPDRFEKAMETGADLVILDLEDAVAGDNKQLARDEVVRWLSAREGNAGSPVVQVRINPPRDASADSAASAESTSAVGAADLAALAAVNASFELRAPKVESADDVDRVAEAAPGHPVTALLETARGVENAAAIARHPSVTRLALGESDLASDLGTSAPEAMDYARVRVLFAARAARLGAPMLSAFTDIRDLDGLRSDTERGRALGWLGRTAVHPSQLQVIAEVFRPSAGAEAWARGVLAATKAGGVTTLASGEMVDDAMVGRARGILSLIAADEARVMPEPREN